MSAKIYYVGLCRLCSREIEHYRRQDGSEKFQFIDITAENFDGALEGLDPILVHKEMHVKRQVGSVRTGVDAFIEFWDYLLHYRWAAKAARLNLLKPLLHFSYTLFARIHPWLPKKKINCSSSSYCETHR